MALSPHTGFTGQHVRDGALWSIRHVKRGISWKVGPGVCCVFKLEMLRSNLLVQDT